MGRYVWDPEASSKGPTGWTGISYATSATLLEEACTRIQHSTGSLI